MFDSQLLLMGGTTIFGPWLSREADSARFTLDITATSGAPLTIKVEVFTKNTEQGGDGNNAAGASGTSIAPAAGSTGRTTVEWDSTTLVGAGDSGLLELVRYKYTVTGDSTEWILFRMLDPVWYDAVR